jgi:hypothetical protein
MSNSSLDNMDGPINSSSLTVLDLPTLLSIIGATIIVFVVVIVGYRYYQKHNLRSRIGDVELNVIPRAPSIPLGPTVIHYSEPVQTRHGILEPGDYRYKWITISDLSRSNRHPRDESNPFGLRRVLVPVIENIDY